MGAYKTKLGHTHLKVSDLDRSIAFYTRFLSLKLVEVVSNQYAFLTDSDFHHEIALNNVGAEAPRPPHYSTGLFHVAFEVPDKSSFARAYQMLVDAGVRVAAVDHLISWAMYFDDPDGNGLEIYCDTRQDPEGAQLWQGRNRPLTPEKILAARLDQG